MRKIINIVEGKKTITDLDNELTAKIAQSKGELSKAQSTSVDVPGKQASKEKSARINAPIDPESSRLFGHLHASGLKDDVVDGDIDFEYDDVKPTTPENLPAIISKAIVSAGGEIIPEWHMVKNLPGYMSSAIRALGRQVFMPFTNTPIEKIQVVSTLSNSETEVKALMAWIKQNGIKNDDAQLYFTEILPQYAPHVQIWNVRGYTFMLVKDHAGFYVYGFNGDKIGHTNHKQIEKPLDEMEVLIDKELEEALSNVKPYDRELEKIANRAQNAANRDGVPYAVFNLNKVGARMLVIRPSDSFPDEDRMVAGPFIPE